MIKSIYIKQFNWWNIRLFAILGSPICLFELEFFFLIQTFIFDHFQLGIKNIFQDYLNNLIIQILYSSILRILILQLIRVNLELWF